MSSFRTILIIFFVGAFVFAVLVFSNIIKIGKTTTQTAAGTVTIWGPFPLQSVQQYIDNLNIDNSALHISYVQKSSDNIHDELVESIASGTAPDLVIFSDKTFLPYRNRLYVAPYENYPERLYRDTYIDGASTFLTGEGIQLFPLVVDPMVVYYNKDILANAKYITPPTTWNGLNAAVALIIRKDVRGSIVQSPIALGESENVDHFKDILSTLFLQTGSKIVSLPAGSTAYTADLDTATNSEVSPQTQALQYYTSFADPTNPLYSWNKSLPSSLDTFLAGKSAFYLGRASELFTIQQRNPNLNFDVTQIFEPENQTRPITYGELYGIGIIKSSKNFTASYATALQLADKPFVDFLSKQISLPPARRDLLLGAAPNAYVSVFFQAAAGAFPWPDPNSATTTQIFSDMIRKVNSGAADPGQAIYEASKALQSSIK